MKGSSGKPRAGAVRKKGKGQKVGTGGHSRKALEGKGPTPKAEDRPYHQAHKKKAAAERAAAKSGGRGGQRQAAPRGASGAARRAKSGDESEIVTGRNAVVEALRTRVPATTLYLASRIEMDDRVKEAVKVATGRGIPILEVMRPELDRLAGEGGVHQGLALKVPPYEYAHAEDLLDQVIDSGLTPLFVALDGVTDPRNLGAIIRSTAAFGGQGVIVPQRRSVGVTAAAWKTSAGAAARVPVAMASNLTQTLKALKQRGVFVLGLDGDGDVSLPGLDFADRPIVIVVGSEGKGLSRLVTETCDAVVSIPISAATESLNAGIAASVTLYEVARLRASRPA
ncbi:23S rRNA (guanosine(2251)-2'-O)-methyltransferase RlmB [Agromyces marinus]|uniref:23S rRNA (Guanosine(2251)-2'-O)-methyltransferase RlmB n=1 Tax=Agromyces marinus TaxID=1389020 RepID=A0ABN6YI62_9MICO|nr:23S rRNA (guanosine(2251)-2'-O)-methyltransferase RlmB [Agromyces marinus]UIP59285.1 putative tRNA/rRNA methyltransferase [Agromyces marinus]BDZ55696.1 23S rRNA (guanosine(2251)-2'-O)-methyltransferase RlmB [Agromyces marinus]